jgi:hypothetical protein
MKSSILQKGIVGGAATEYTTRMAGVKRGSGRSIESGDNHMRKTVSSY